MDEIKIKNEEKLINSRPYQGIGKVVGFFCLLIALCFLLDIVIYSGLRRIKTSEFGVWNEIVEGNVNADIIITGSSRAHSHYDPRIIEMVTGRKTYNIGLNGSQTDMQLARLKAYLQHNSKPALVIHNLDLFSFQVTHGGVFDPGKYQPYLKEQAIYEAMRQINPEVWKARYLPLYGYAVEDLRFTWLLGLAGFFKWNPAQDHFLGFRPKHTDWTEDFERFKQMNPKGVRFEVEPEGIKQMDELLSLCRSQGIDVLLVYSPEYQEMQAMTSNRAKIFAHFDALGKRFAVPVWDYSDSPISSSRGNFYNSQHLNAEGATLFSKDLAARISADPALSKVAAASRAF